MLIKDTIDKNDLVFIRSKNIKVFPCGRRRALVDSDGSTTTVSDRYYIPFDPEARLNTEANQRKHSGLNGFKQNYLYKWGSDGQTGHISLVLGGYLFDIVASNYATVAAFGAGAAEKLGISSGSIFVNIKLANVEFFSGATNVPSAYTEILRDQTTSIEPIECLDLLYGTDKTNSDNYYFCGLSLSKINLEKTDLNKGWVSLQLFDYVSDTWVIHEASRLPEIDHGDTEDSVKIPGDLQVVKNLHVGGNTSINGSLTASDVVIKGPNGDMHAVTLEVAENDENKWQLKFYNAKTSPYNK